MGHVVDSEILLKIIYIHYKYFCGIKLVTNLRQYKFESQNTNSQGTGTGISLFIPRQEIKVQYSI